MTSKPGSSYSPVTVILSGFTTAMGQPKRSVTESVRSGTLTAPSFGLDETSVMSVPVPSFFS